MRYVILIVLLGIFVVWDVTQNEARWMEKAGNFTQRMVHKIF
jgi:hypothetical protein